MTIVEQLDFAVIVPMANEANEFTEFTTCLREVLLGFPKGRVYFIVDNASKDNTLELCRQFSLQNKQFLKASEFSGAFYFKLINFALYLKN